MNWKTISICTATQRVEIDAVVFGNWAAHAGYGPDPDWSVTMVSDGRRLATHFTKRDAIKVAKALSEAGYRRLRECQRDRYIVEAIVAEAAA